MFSYQQFCLLGKTLPRFQNPDFSDWCTRLSPRQHTHKKAAMFSFTFLGKKQYPESVQQAKGANICLSPQPFFSFAFFDPVIYISIPF